MFRFVVLHLIILFLLRLVFYFVFKMDETFESAVLTKSFWLGTRFDLRLTLIFLFPFILIAWGRRSPFHSPLAMRWWTAFYTFVGACWLTFYVVDFGFYSYLKSRLNSTIFNTLD